jgi:hypothetical protein
MDAALDRWRADNELLAHIGEELSRLDTRVTVRISRQAAEGAVAAWQRDDGSSPPASETDEERIVRHRAGSLALIGLAVQDHGRWDDDGVDVPLGAWFIGHALDCADAHGRITGPPIQ